MEYLFDMPDTPVVTGLALSESNNAGLQAELTFALQAVSRGWEVFMPLCHATKADCIIRRSKGSPITIQIKRAVFQKHSRQWKIVLGSGKPSHLRGAGIVRYTKYTRGDFDIIAIYVSDRNDFYLARLSDCLDKSTVHLKSDTRLGNWEILEDWQ